MISPLSIDLEHLDWQPHPTLPGIDIKLFKNEASFPPVDVLVARVAIQGEIPWHVHPTDSEIAYGLQGRGILYCAADEAHETVSETAMSCGGVVIVPPGVWHAVRNTGEEDLLIFATHTPQST